MSKFNFNFNCPDFYTIEELAEGINFILKQSNKLSSVEWFLSCFKENFNVIVDNNLNCISVYYFGVYSGYLDSVNIFQAKFFPCIHKQYNQS